MRDMALGIMEFDERHRPQRTLSSPSPAAASAQSSLNSSNNNNNNIASNKDDARSKLLPRVGERRTMKDEGGGGVRGWMSMLFAGPNSTSSRSRRKKSMRRMKKEKSIREEEQVFGGDNMEDEDEDSYELELSERLNRERQVTGLRTTSQDGVKSPLVEQFINSHKLQWSPSNSSTCSSLSLGSLCDPLASQSDQLQLNETAQELLLGKRRSLRPAQGDLEVERERDDRLIGWRLMAARGNPNGLSLLSESSDSELELLHCQGPAEADDCSDDTSCSSVELVWTRPRQNSPPPAPTVASQPMAIKCSQQHQFSVFELAKPSRAKGKAFGQRRAKESGKSSEQNLDAQKWVANPLFSSSEELEQQVPREGDEEKRHQSCESLLEAKRSDGETKEEEEDWLERDNRKRWSLRGKSPFSISRDNIYLNQLRNNLRSNVCSIRSQLSVRISDTGKRASVLADQLLASIKDTTKELVVGDRPDEAQNEGEDSFAGANSLQDAGGIHSSEAGGLQRTKMFSLIYQHQQQANGQPVITRQPRPAGALNHHQGSSFSPPVGPSDSQAPERLLLAPEEETGEKSNNNNVEEQCDKETCAKSLRRKHRLANASKRLHRSRSDDDGDDETNEEDFFKAEYDKAKATTSAGRRTRLRSLNYWRRFRLRYQSGNGGGQLSTSY